MVGFIHFILALADPYGKLVSAHYLEDDGMAGERKQQIIEEAARLFSRLGYDRVTVKQIGDTCGITEPAIYRHFPSKDAVYDAVLDSIEERMETGPLFDRLSRESEVQALLLHLASHVIEFFTVHDDLYRLLLFSALKEHAKARHVYDVMRGTYVHFLKSQFDRLYDEGSIIEKNNEITARCFIGMVFDCALSRTLWRGMQGTVYNPADVVANNVPIYAKGLLR